MGRRRRRERRKKGREGKKEGGRKKEGRKGWREGGKEKREKGGREEKRKTERKCLSCISIINCFYVLRRGVASQASLPSNCLLSINSR